MTEDDDDDKSTVTEARNPPSPSTTMVKGGQPEEDGHFSIHMAEAVTVDDRVSEISMTVAVVAAVVADVVAAAFIRLYFSFISIFAIGATALSSSVLIEEEEEEGGEDDDDDDAGGVRVSKRKSNRSTGRVNPHPQAPPAEELGSSQERKKGPSRNSERFMEDEEDDDDDGVRSHCCINACCSNGMRTRLKMNTSLLSIGSSSVLLIVSVVAFRCASHSVQLTVFTCVSRPFTRKVLF